MTLSKIEFVAILLVLLFFIAATANLLNFYMEVDKPTESEIKAEEAYIESLKLYIETIKEQIAEIERKQNYERHKTPHQ